MQAKWLARIWLIARVVPKVWQIIYTYIYLQLHSGAKCPSSGKLWDIGGGVANNIQLMGAGVVVKLVGQAGKRRAGTPTPLPVEWVDPRWSWLGTG